MFAKPEFRFGFIYFFLPRATKSQGYLGLSILTKQILPPRPQKKACLGSLSLVFGETPRWKFPRKETHSGHDAPRQHRKERRASAFTPSHVAWQTVCVVCLVLFPLICATATNCKATGEKSAPRLRRAGCRVQRALCTLLEHRGGRQASAAALPVEK